MRTNIFEFSDFKEFIRAYLEAQRQNGNPYSIGMWARQLGIKNRSTLVRIVNGTRLPGDDIFKILSEFFKFTPEEADYLFLLIRKERDKAIACLRQAYDMKLDDIRSKTLTA